MEKTVNTEYSTDNHVMVDIETLSTKNNAVVTQLSMVRFCPMTGETFERFNHHINIKSCLDLGLVIDESTLSFWLQQSKEAKNAAIKFGDDSEHVVVVMHEAWEFLSQIEDVRMWGKGPSFDLTKLSTIYNLLDYPDKPWKYYFERCVRTMTADVDSARELKFDGIPHNAIDDCIHQINQVKQALHVKR